MADPVYLHIHSRDRRSSRVMAVVGESVRVGRGHQCEARLGEGQVAEVECLLRRRDETWYVQPLSADAKVSVDGRPVRHLRALAPGVPLRVGDDYLTLRATEAPPTRFGTIEVPAYRQVDPPASEEFSEPVAEIASEARPRSAPHGAIEPLALPRNTRPPRPRMAPSLRPSAARWEPGDLPRAKLAGTASPPGRSEVGKSTPDDSRVAPVEEADGGEIRPPGDDVEPLPIRDDATADPFVERVASHESDEMGADVSAWVETPSRLDAHPKTTAIDEPSPSQGIAEIGQKRPPSGAAGGPNPPDATTQEPPPSSDPIPGKTRIDDAPEDREPAGRPTEPVSVLPDPDSADDDAEWPSAKVILAACRVEDVASKAPRSPSTKPRAKERPTVPSAPSQWSGSLVRAGLPLSLLTLAACAAGVFLALEWGRDDFESGLLADRLLGSRPAAFEAAEVNPDAAWWRTTGGHLSLKAAALATAPREAGVDESVGFLLDVARAEAPLEPSAHLARAHRDPKSSHASLGLSRDFASLAATGRHLLRQGKEEAALRAFGEAMSLAVEADPSRCPAPSYLEDRATARFALPQEETLATMVRELASGRRGEFAAWSSALPEQGVALLAAHRVLSDLGRPEARAVLDRLVRCDRPPEGCPAAPHLAARAEGLAAVGRRDEAADLYAEAIAALDDPALARTFHLNRGIILARSGERDRALEALASARDGRGDDAIGRRVGQAMAREGLMPKPAAALGSAAYELKTN